MGIFGFLFVLSVLSIDLGGQRDGPRLVRAMDLATPGAGRSRVQDFLLSTLKCATQLRYTGALEALETRLSESAGMTVDECDEEALDWWVSDWMVEHAESSFAAIGDAAAEPLEEPLLPRSFFGSVLSSLARTRPRLRLKTAWRVYDVWGQKAPVRQAPAAPPEVLLGVATLLACVGRPIYSAIMLTCYTGLLRVGEALNLCHRDLFFSQDCVVLVLGVTKRGLEQKVVLRDPGTVAWLQQYVKRFPGGSADRLFPASYTTFLKWLRQAAVALGAGGLGLSTHSLRRSGTSELSRLGLPLADLLAYGRWLSERSAREYVRRGEVAILRSREACAPLLRRCARWAKLLPSAFELAELLETVFGAVPLRKVNSDLVQRLETLMTTMS